MGSHIVYTLACLDQNEDTPESALHCTVEQLYQPLYAEQICIHRPTTSKMNNEHLNLLINVRILPLWLLKEAFISEGFAYETNHGKITRHYSRYSAVAFCCVHKCLVSYNVLVMTLNWHPHRVNLFRIGRVGSWFGIGKGSNVIISK